MAGRLGGLVGKPACQIGKDLGGDVARCCLTSEPGVEFLDEMAPPVLVAWAAENVGEGFNRMATTETLRFGEAAFTVKSVGSR